MAVLSVSSAPAAAQDSGRRTARALRVYEPPVIDGRLTEQAWSRAQPIGELICVEPVEGAEPSEATDVRFLYDDDHLYVGVRCFDRDPDQIIVRLRERDARLGDADKIEMIFDTYLDRRNAFFFQMNPAGSKGDALVSDNGADFNKPWDGIWQGKTSIDAEGWVAEIALPFKTLNFRPGLDTWGFNISRDIGRRNEVVRWSGARQDVSGVFRVVEAGDLTGLEGIRQGVGLDVVPFFTGNWINDQAEGEETVVGEPGLDVFYKLTPSLTASLTLNTDFAETEVDDRQINLTRFPLFFPERRDFFLQDAGLFGFADLQTGSRGNDLIPFFSRTIGLAQGEEVPIIAGAKLTGRAGPYNIGVLDVQTDDVRIDDPESGPFDVAGENLFVARVSRNVGEQSNVGVLVTHGDPRSDADNTTYGLDANFRTSSFRGNRQLTANAWFLESVSQGVSGDDRAYGASLRYPNDLWNWGLSFKEIGRNFDPALGFVPRVGIRKYDGSAEYQPRVGAPSGSSSSGSRRPWSPTSAATSRRPRWRSSRWASSSSQATRSGSRWSSSTRTCSRTSRSSTGSRFPRGEYDFTRARFELDSAQKRPVSLNAGIGVGEFFDGRRETYSIGVDWRPNALFTGDLEYSHNEVSLAAGDFQTQVARLRLNFSFSPEVSWNNFIQWDNASDTFGLNSRWRWIPVPGQELFLVFNQTLLEEDETLRSRFQGLALKLSYTLRF